MKIPDPVSDERLAEILKHSKATQDEARSLAIEVVAVRSIRKVAEAAKRGVANLFTKKPVV